MVVGSSPMVGVFEFCATFLIYYMAKHTQKGASAGNRTRVTSMATMYSTTRPLMLTHSDNGKLLTRLHTYNVRVKRSQNRKTTAAGFEPARAEPNGFLVHLLNHSDTLS